jgi:hypothetical protein
MGTLLVAGSLLGFLRVLDYWMIPVDLPAVRRKPAGSTSKEKIG